MWPEEYTYQDWEWFRNCKHEDISRQRFTPMIRKATQTKAKRVQPNTNNIRFYRRATAERY